MLNAWTQDVSYFTVQSFLSVYACAQEALNFQISLFDAE